MNEKAVTISLVCSLLALSGCGSGTSEDSVQRVRIGVYDSRAVALAYWRTEDRLDRHHVPLVEQIEQARAAGDEQLAKELDEELWAHRKLVHRQVFSTESVDDILEHISDTLPEIRAAAGVTQLVSKWDKGRLAQYGSAELVDVTSPLVDAFKPDERTLGMIREMAKHKPVTPEQAEHHH